MAFCECFPEYFQAILLCSVPVIAGWLYTIIAIYNLIFPAIKQYRNLFCWTKISLPLHKIMFAHVKNASFFHTKDEV